MSPEANFKNRTLFIRDNLEIMRGMNSECVDLIYLDPPFNSGQEWAAPVGSAAAGAAFKDAWTLDDLKEEWVEEIEATSPALHHAVTAAGFTHGPSMQGYLSYMAIRLLEMKRILKPTGSIYLHCDPTAGHYLKTVMDSIFGGANLIDEIVWNYGTPSGGRSAGKKPVKTHDTLLAYAVNYGTHTYNKQFTPYSDKYVNNWFRHTDEDGRKYQTRSRQGTIIRQYLDESPGVPLSNTWTDIMQLYGSSGWFPGNRTEITNYPTQKPVALLERIITASSNPGDLVFDPFCGCATTCVAAEKLEREWVGIDLSAKAYDLIVQRLAREVRVGSAEAPTLTDWQVIRREDIPIRSDQTQQRSKTIKARLYGQQAGNCNGCGEHFQLRNLTLDHVVPQAKGGADADANLQLLCGACNSVKGGRRTHQELLVELRKQGVRR